MSFVTGRIQIKVVTILPFLPAATKLGLGNVLQASVILSTGGGLPQCMLGCQSPWDQRPPGPGRHTPWDQRPPRTRQTPRDQRPLWTRQTPPRTRDPPDQADTPWDQRPPRTRQTPPGTRDPPDQADPQDQADTPRTRQTPPRTGDPRTRQTPPSGSRRQHTVNERSVRILLECILVLSSVSGF